MKSIFKIITVVFFIVCILFILTACGTKEKTSSKQSKKVEETIQIKEENDVDNEEKKENVVRDELKSYSENIGDISNLEFVDNFDNYYRYKQMYNGIEVYGGGISVSLEDNKINNIVDYSYSVPESFNIEPENSENDLLEIAKDTLNTNKRPSDSKLIIYPKNMTDFELAYFYDFGFSKIIISDKDKSILSKYSAINDANGIDDKLSEIASSDYLESNDELETIEKLKQKDGTYVLSDSYRNIQFYKIKDEYDTIESEEFLENSNKYYDIRQWDSLNEMISLNDYKSELQAMENLQKIYDYYYNEFNHKSIIIDEDYTLKVLTNFNKMIDDDGETIDYSNNAALVYFNKNDIRIYLGSLNYWNDDLDVMGHEYGHGYVNLIAEVGDDNQTKAVNEGYADIFGMLAEAYYNDSKLDGNVGIRDIKGSLLKYNEYTEDIDYHNMSPIISRVAYLMSINDDLDLSFSELEKIWFYSLYKLPKHIVTFDDVEIAVLLQAKELGLSREKIEAIADIFVSLNYPDYCDACIENTVTSTRKVKIIDENQAVNMLKNEIGNWKDVKVNYEYISTTEDILGNQYYVINAYALENIVNYSGEWLEQIPDGRFYFCTYYVSNHSVLGYVYVGQNNRDYEKYNPEEKVDYFMNTFLLKN